jgi:HEAT repeat protein
MSWFSSAQVKAKDPRRRIEAIAKLEEARDQQSMTLVMSALGDHTVEVRLEALRVIARWRDKNSFRALVHVLRDPHPDVRERAILELRTMGGRESIPSLVPCLSDPVASVRAQAVPTLAYLGWIPQTPTEHVLDFIGRNQFSNAAAIGRVALDFLLPFVGHACISTRRDVAEALGQQRDERVYAALEKFLADADAGVRIAAMTSLARLKASISVLERMIADPDKNVRVAAVEILGERKDTEAVPALLRCLKDEYWGVRCAAAAALGLIGERTSVPLLIDALNDPDPDMRVACTEALGLIGDVEAIEPLVLAQLDPEARVRQAALRSVLRVDYKWQRNPRAYRTLLQVKRALRSDDFSVRNAATELLERIFSIRRQSFRSTNADGEAERRVQAAEMLIVCLWDDDALLRGAAAEALGHLRARRALDVLKVKAEDAHDWVRGRATAALVQVEAKETSTGGWRPAT